ncbi:class I SAM-dependent methyltransferase [Thermosynechococcus sp.]|uniref:class I SAM-dependent methyltransferase n=1 Tax=Thermosynechococcus sp. TaxID=2814275 RepID=UPI003919EBBF
MTEDVTSQAAHFAFGKNWADYATKISEQQINKAEKGLERLLGRDAIRYRRFLDIGCGSGIHTLAALRLGVSEALAVDIDPDSVATTQALLEQWAPSTNWHTQTISVFDLKPSEVGTFDIVYSWGVLHHTGDMKRAICRASEMVKEGGLFAFALYRRTLFDLFWKWEKRWYSTASPKAQDLARNVYTALFRFRFWTKGRSFKEYVTSYSQNRGMVYENDVHDWLGGWPYETISPSEVEKVMHQLGFTLVRAFTKEERWIGILGNGCDEYVYQRR